MNTSRFAKFALFMAMAACAPLAALAQDFPAKQPVKLIVTFAPGGGTDTIARTLNTKMGEALGQVVIVENKAGAGGAIATDFVAKSQPDGYNVLFIVSSHSINQALMPALPFDTERDLRGVTLIGALPQVLAMQEREAEGDRGYLETTLLAHSRRRHDRRVRLSRLRIGRVDRHVRARATPNEVVDKLHESTLVALKDPAVRARMESQAGQIIGGSPSELDTLVAREIRQLTKVVREQNLKPE